MLTLASAVGGATVSPVTFLHVATDDTAVLTAFVAMRWTH